MCIGQIKDLAFQGSTQLSRGGCWQAASQVDPLWERAAAPEQFLQDILRGETLAPSFSLGLGNIGPFTSRVDQPVPRILS